MDFGAFGQWWDSQDWGAVPTWVGALLTSGSLFLTARILVRDRRLRVRAEANAFVTWTRSTYARRGSGSENWTFEIHARNGNEAPIFGVKVWVVDRNPMSYIDLPYHFDNTQLVRSKEEVETSLQLTERISNFRFAIEFQDSRGEHWYRNLQTYKYMSPRKHRKFIRPPKGYVPKKGEFRDPLDLF